MKAMPIKDKQKHATLVYQKKRSMQLLKVAFQVCYMDGCTCRERERELLKVCSSLQFVARMDALMHT